MQKNSFELLKCNNKSELPNSLWQLRFVELLKVSKALWFTAKPSLTFWGSDAGGDFSHLGFAGFLSLTFSGLAVIHVCYYNVLEDVIV